MESFTAIMRAGIMDGVTPCAFATILFFLSVIFFACRTYRQVMVWAGCFLASVLTGLVLLSFGVFENVRALGAFDVLTNSLYTLLAGAAVGLGLLTMIDWWRLRTPRPQQRIFLPIHLATIDGTRDNVAAQRVGSLKKVREWTVLIMLAVVSGLLLSVMATRCIGQLYLPVIIEVLQSQGYYWRAVAHVALYNGMYMLPLLAAGMAAGRMMRPAAAERLPQKISKIRVIFGGAFFGLGFGLLYMVL